MRFTSRSISMITGLIAFGACQNLATSEESEHEQSASNVFLSRPSSSNADLVGFGFFSHSDPGARRDYIHTDDVTLEESHTMTSIRWWGLMDGVVSDPETNERWRAENLESLENLSEFTLRIYASNEDGTPADQIVFEHSTSLQACDPQPTGRVGIGREQASPCPELVFSMSLPEGVTLEAGTKYHFAIAAKLVDPHAMNWQWSDCDTVDGFTYSYSYKRERWSGLQDTDSALELIGHSVP